VHPFTLTPGSPGSPVILHVPHGSRRITTAARPRLLLDDTALEAELDHMTDSHTAEIAERAAARTTATPWLFSNTHSRLVVDPERFPDEREEMTAVGMGAVYTRTHDGSVLRNEDPLHTEELLAAHYRPYAQALSDLVDDRLATVGRVVIIDVHSYPSKPLPYELHSDGPRPALCLGTDTFHTPPELTATARSSFAYCNDVEVNTPFSGCYIPLRHYQQDPRVSGLMVEIRRDTYSREPGGPTHDGIVRIAQSLADLINNV
jgi:N-formylglutamate amidohydrolase